MSDDNVTPHSLEDDIPLRAEASAMRISTRTAVILMIFCVAFTALMALTYFATKPAIDASAQLEKLQLINAVLPSGSYDNDLLRDTVSLPPTPALGLDDETLVYRARKGGEAAAVVMEAAAPDGYSGRIGLLLAVKANGELAAIRVTAHKETPGLGDYIDPAKDRNKIHPWIAQFNDASFDKTPADRFKVKKDGGDFTFMAGATISPRAVTNATRRALAWALKNKEKLFAQPTGEVYKEQP